MRSINALPKDTVYDQMNSPLGLLTILTSAQGVQAILWDLELPHFALAKGLHTLSQAPQDPLLLKTRNQLNEYFQGQRKIFDLPLAPQGSDFQISAWQELRKIPYAQTISYAEQALRLGDKNKCRAVGMANSRNPISIIIPCHRVIGSQGQLTGFTGGLDKKRYLLEWEKTCLESAT